MVDVGPKRVLGAVALLGLFAVVVVTFGASAVHPSCDDVVNTTDADTIQDRIDAAANGTTICLGGGSYEEELTVNKTELTLRKHNATDFPVVENTTTLVTGMEIVNESVTVQGVNVTGFDGNGINVTDHNVTIRGVNVSNNGNHGILFAGPGPEDGGILDSRIDTSGAVGVRIDSSERVTVEANTVDSNNDVGVWIASASHDAEVRNNTVVDTVVSDNIRITDSERVAVTANTATGAGSGSGADGIELNGAADATVANNTVNDNADRGVFVDNLSDDAVIANNTILRNNDNVRIVTSNRVAVTGNNASESLDDGIILIDVPEGTVANNTVLAPGDEGIDLDGTSHDSVVRGNLVNGSVEHGVAVESDDVLIVDNVVRDSGANGIFFGDLSPTNNTVRDTTVTASALWAFNTTAGGINFAERLNVGDSTKPDTTLSFEARNASVRGNGSSQPSNANAEPLDRYFDAEDNDPEPYLDVVVHYTDSDVSNIDESTVAVWNLSGGSWVELPSTVDTGANTVSSNITGFSPFGAFGAEDTSGDGGDGGDGTGPSADFVVTSATVSKVRVTVGENLTVTATVENRGDAGGTQGVGFRMDDGIIRSRSLHLAAGETGTVSLTHAYDDTGTYHVSVQDVAAGNVTVVAADGSGQPDIRVTQPSLSPMSVTVGESAEACATFENRGDATGSVNVQVTLEGQTVGTERVTVAAGASETVCRSFTPSEAGEFEVEVNGALAGTLVVQAAEDGGEDGETVPGFGPVAAAVSLAVVARIVERRR